MTSGHTRYALALMALSRSSSHTPEGPIRSVQHTLKLRAATQDAARPVPAVARILRRPSASSVCWAAAQPSPPRVAYFSIRITALVCANVIDELLRKPDAVRPYIVKKP